MLRSVSSDREAIDKLYFESYEDEAIHEEMLKDAIRTNTYLESLRIASPNKIVIDVGAGSGVLSIFAA